jgi:AcrR family transcriptional regulator
MSMRGSGTTTAEAPSGVRTDRRGVERRRRIIEAAMDVFTRKGFRTGSLNEVAEIAGVTAQGVLYHFKSKDELLLAVIRERDRRHGVVIEELSREHPWGLITNAVRFAELGEDDPNLLALHTVLEIESTDPDSPAYEYFKERNRVLLRGLVKTLKAAKKSKFIRADVDCDQVAGEILAFEYGVSVLWLKNPKTSMVDLYRAYFDRLVEDLTRDL